MSTTRYQQQLVDEALYTLYMGCAVDEVMGAELRRRGLAEGTPPRLTDYGRRVMVDRLAANHAHGAPVPGESFPDKRSPLHSYWNDDQDLYTELAVALGVLFIFGLAALIVTSMVGGWS